MIYYLLFYYILLLSHTQLFKGSATDPLELFLYFWLNTLFGGTILGKLFIDMHSMM